MLHITNKKIYIEKLATLIDNDECVNDYDNDDENVV